MKQLICRAINQLIKITVMISTFFWDVTQRRLVVSYRRFGTTYRSRLQRSMIVTGVSWQHIGPICKGQLPLEDGTDRLFRNVGDYHWLLKVGPTGYPEINLADGTYRLFRNVGDYNWPLKMGLIICPEMTLQMGPIGCPETSVTIIDL
jgi:hypothetical protein